MCLPTDLLRTLIVKPMLGAGACCVVTTLIVSYAMGVSLYGSRELCLSLLSGSPDRNPDKAEPGSSL